MKMFKKLACGLMAVLMMASLAACGDGGGDSSTESSAPASSDGAGNNEGDTVKVAVFLYQASDTYISSVSNSLKELASGYGVEILGPHDCANDQTKQNEFIQQEIDKGEAQVLAVNVVSVGSAQQVAEMAKDADLPLIFFNREPADGGEAVYSDYDKVKFVGTEIEQAGVLQGEMVVDYWKDNSDADKNGDGKLQYVMLRGEDGNAEAQARTEYAVNTIKDNGVEVEELGAMTADWDTNKAADIMNNWVSQYGDDIEFVLCNNDGMAIGALTALQNAGYNTGDDSKYIPIYGVDATTDAIARIEAGEMEATVQQDNVAMAEAVLAMAANAGKGSDFIDGTPYDYDDSNNAVRIDYKKYTG